MEAVEKQINQESLLSNILIGCHLKYQTTFTEYKLSDKKDIIAKLKDVVVKYALTGKNIDNPYIICDYIQPHDRFSICISDGWFQEYVSFDKLKKAIDDKNLKVVQYREYKNIPMWLVIVILYGPGSYDINNYEEILSWHFESKFDKVYLYHHSLNRLIELTLNK